MRFNVNELHFFCNSLEIDSESRFKGCLHESIRRPNSTRIANCKGWEIRCSVDAKSSKIRARSHSKSFPEAARGIKNCCQEHRQQQIGPPGSCWASILTPGRLIWAFWGLNLEPRGLMLLPWRAILGAKGFHSEGPGAPRGSTLLILHQICRIHENH